MYVIDNDYLSSLPWDWTEINVKERVNFINLKRKLESVYFDRSCQNRAIRYFKILPMFIEYRIL